MIISIYRSETHDFEVAFYNNNIAISYRFIGDSVGVAYITSAQGEALVAEDKERIARQKHRLDFNERLQKEIE